VLVWGIGVVCRGFFRFLVGFLFCVLLFLGAGSCFFGFVFVVLFVFVVVVVLLLVGCGVAYVIGGLC